jgi:transcriptional regulator with XRE-family HTH domain
MEASRQTKAEGARAFVRLRRWRRLNRLPRREAAARLGISERQLAYFESGEKPIPKHLDLTIRALLNEMSPEFDMGRNRWVKAVENLLSYGRGEPVLGRLLRTGNSQEILDFLALAKYGPSPDTALTDPALFRALREAGTKLYLNGGHKLFMPDGMSGHKDHQTPKKEKTHQSETPEADGPNIDM